MNTQTFNNMKTPGDILTKDITAHKPKMEHPVVEVILFDAADVVIASKEKSELPEHNLG